MVPLTDLETVLVAFLVAAPSVVAVSVVSTVVNRELEVGSDVRRCRTLGMGDVFIFMKRIVKETKQFQFLSFGHAG